MMHKAIRLSAFLAAVVILNGCAIAWFGVGAGLGVSAYRYIEGALERDYALTYDAAWEATNTALSNQFISVKDSTNDGTRGKIEAIRKDGKNVLITLKYKQKTVTSVKIRVGILGNQEEAKHIHEEISSVTGLR